MIVWIIIVPLLQCDPEEQGSCDDGCNGGLMTTAFEYLLKAGGVQREQDYPYSGRGGTCKFDKSKIAASVANFSVVSIDEDQIAANLVKNGPLAGLKPLLDISVSAIISVALTHSLKCSTSPFACCSGHKCSLHADLPSRSVLPIHLHEAFGPRCASGRVWFSWICAYQVQEQGLLDHKELMGRKLGREWLLQNM